MWWRSLTALRCIHCTAWWPMQMAHVHMCPNAICRSVVLKSLHVTPQKRRMPRCVACSVSKAGRRYGSGAEGAIADAQQRQRAAGAAPHVLAAPCGARLDCVVWIYVCHCCVLCCVYAMKAFAHEQACLV